MYRKHIPIYCAQAESFPPSRKTECFVQFVGSPLISTVIEEFRAGYKSEWPRPRILNEPPVLNVQMRGVKNSHPLSRDEEKQFIEALHRK